MQNSRIEQCTRARITPWASFLFLNTAFSDKKSVLPRISSTFDYVVALPYRRVRLVAPVSPNPE